MPKHNFLSFIYRICFLLVISFFSGASWGAESDELKDCNRVRYDSLYHLAQAEIEAGHHGKGFQLLDDIEAETQRMCSFDVYARYQILIAETERSEILETDALARMHQLQNQTHFPDLPPATLAFFYNRKAAILSQLSKPASLVIANSRKALSIAKSENNRSLQAGTENEIGYYFENIAQFDSAIHYYSLSINQFKELNDLRSLCSVYHNLARVHWKKGNLNVVLATVAKGKPIAKANQWLKLLSEFELLEIEVFSKKQNWKKAYDTLVAYHHHLLKYNNTKFNEELANRRIELETQKKENALIQEKANNHILSSELEAQKNQKLFLTTVILSLLLFFAFIIYSLRKSRSNNRQLQQYNQQLKESNQVKAFLVEEIHHRIKNNLVSLQGILSLQKRHTTNQDQVEFLERVMARIQSYRKTHEILNYKKDQTRVNISNYLNQLSHSVQEGVPFKTTMNISVAELPMHMDQCMSLGMIFCELFTNTIKHAKTPNRLEVTLELTHVSDNHIAFRYSDNGEPAPLTKASTGTEIIEIFMKKLRGKKQPTTRPFDLHFEFPIS